MQRRGFTLLEMLTVVAIVAICASIAVFGLNRNRDAISVERASALLRARVERAQSLAAIAGSRLGTGRVVYAAPCPQAGAQYLWVQINPGGTAVIPSGVDYNAGTDRMTVTCEVWDIAAETKNSGQFEFPTNVTVFGFTADGRVVLPGAPVGTVFISIRQINSNRRFGFRVLPSGVMCASSESGSLGCDEDLT